jgi:hypothetical protein
VTASRPLRVFPLPPPDGQEKKSFVRKPRRRRSRATRRP